jgi:cytochrome c-type biogenesis protein CcmH
MTPFLLVTFVMGALTITWLTRPLWHQAYVFADTGIASILQPRRSLNLTTALAIFVLMVAGIGYVWVGAPKHLDVAPSEAASLAATKAAEATKAAAPESRDEPAATGAAGATDLLSQAELRVFAMVDSMAKRLKTRPNDADGWQLLGRSYASLGKHTEAYAAFRTALRIRPDDANLLAESAFSSSMLEPRGQSAEPVRLINHALQIDPNNRKALALAGTLALDRKDYQGAVRHWERLAGLEPPDSKVGKQLQISLAQARQLSGTQATLTPAVAWDSLSPPPFVVQKPAANAAQQVSGTVTLAPSLAARASPDDTVFIYARTAGSRVPLAVLKKQVRDLPLQFTLDDSLSMSASSKLSSASKVVVGARVAKGGKATASKGDLQGQLAAVPLGSGGLNLQINEVVGVR